MQVGSCEYSLPISWEAKDDYANAVRADYAARCPGRKLYSMLEVWGGGSIIETPLV